MLAVCGRSELIIKALLGLCQARTVDREGPPRGHPLGRRRGRVQAGEPGDRGATLGHPEEQAQHELREAEQSPSVS